jgi:hypothetical protein
VLSHAAPSIMLPRCCFKRGNQACFGVFHHTFGGAASDGAPQRAIHAAPSAVLPAVLLQAGRPGVLPHAAFSTVMKQLQPQQLQLGV